MKTNHPFTKTRLLFVLIVGCMCSDVYSQAWTITGNANIASATQYLGTKDPNDLVIRTNAIERGRVLGAGGTWRFGSAANNARIDSLGRLTFSGQGKYLVGANKYVFQYAATPNYGLFFNTTPLQYEFRNSAATPVFTINATTGAGIFKGALKVGAYTLPGSDGTNGQVLKTNGAGVLSWSSDNSEKNLWSAIGKDIYYNNGKVGIGTMAPTSLLEVNGTALITTLQVTNNAYINKLTIGRGASNVSGNTVTGEDALLSNTTGFDNTVN